MPERKPIQEVYDGFWKENIEVNGEIDKEKLKKFLAEFSHILEQVSIVYPKITGGKITKANAWASNVLRECNIK